MAPDTGVSSLQGSGLIALLALNEQRLANFLQKIEAGYLDNPYHSRVHAAGVLQTTHLLAQNGLIQEGVFDGLLQLSAYLSGEAWYCKALQACETEHQNLGRSMLPSCSAPDPDPAAIRCSNE